MYTICEPVCYCVDFGSVYNNNYIANIFVFYSTYCILLFIDYNTCMVLPPLPTYRLPIYSSICSHIIIIYYTISRVRVLRIYEYLTWQLLSYIIYYIRISDCSTYNSQHVR